ncbi:MAG: hypothetical protein KDD92_10990 [Caldilineaceae bacterium]|nr:hypothetical protein [Caldilineaceae bacterium]
MIRRIELAMLPVIIITLLSVVQAAGGVWAESAPSPTPVPADPHPPYQAAPMPAATGGEALEEVISALPAVVEPAAVGETPAITLWYSGTPRFGHNGEPIVWVNVQGRVAPLNENVSMTYALNGGGQKPLDIGPMPPERPNGPRRLYGAGDFNVEIAYADLNVGSNTIVIRAFENGSLVDTETVTLTYENGNVWRMPYAAEWSEAGGIEDVAQVIDGNWEIENGALRPVSGHLGYDRLVAIGDISWTEYEFVVPVTIRSLDTEDGFKSPSNGPGVGVIALWQGHFRWDEDEQLVNGWQDLGTLSWFHFSRSANVISSQLQMLGRGGGELASKNMAAAFDTQYMMKLRVEEGVSGCTNHYYRYKVWLAGQTEPSNWDLQSCGQNGEPANGSFLLVAHHAEVEFGTVLVTPLDYRATVTAAGSTGGTATVTPNQADYAFYETAEAEATPDSGYAFVGWSGTVTDADGNVEPFSSTDNPLTFPVMGDTNLTANFAESSFTIDVTIDGGDGVNVVNLDPPGPTYALNQPVTLAAVADSGWRFDHWSGAVTGAVSPMNMLVGGNESVTAHFVREYYVLTTDVVDESGQAVEAGVITPSEPASEDGYTYGDMITLTATAATGWEFVRWEGAASGQDVTTSIQITGDMSVQAVFRLQEMTLSISVVGNGGVLPEPEAPPYYYGDTVTLTALADNNWEFTRWEGDVSSAQQQQPVISLTLRDDASVTAVFTEVAIEEPDEELFLPIIRK